MGGKHPKAPAGCFWRGDTLYGRTRIKGRLIVWSLHTSDPKLAAARRKAGKDRMIADVFHGDAKRDFVEVLELWASWIKKEVGPNTAQRYACSLDQMRPWLDGKGLADIDSRLIAEIVRARSAVGVTNATIKRDLVALSSVIKLRHRSRLARKQSGARTHAPDQREARVDRIATSRACRSRHCSLSWHGCRHCAGGDCDRRSSR
jgi:hypothetical protein